MKWITFPRIPPPILGHTLPTPPPLNDPPKLSVDGANPFCMTITVDISSSSAAIIKRRRHRRCTSVVPIWEFLISAIRSGSHHQRSDAISVVVVVGAQKRHHGRHHHCAHHWWRRHQQQQPQQCASDEPAWNGLRHKAEKAQRQKVGKIDEIIYIQKMGGKTNYTKTDIMCECVCVVCASLLDRHPYVVYTYSPHTRQSGDMTRITYIDDDGLTFLDTTFWSLFEPIIHYIYMRILQRRRCIPPSCILILNRLYYV